MPEPTIVSAEVGPFPTGIFDLTRTYVTATFTNGETKKVFPFYPDEIMFYSHEFIGLTESEAHALFHEKDVAYLRS